MSLNYSKCIAPRCYSKGNYSQCNNNKKIGTVFCGKHKKSKYRLDKYPFNTTETDIVEINMNPNNSSNISMSISKKNVLNKKTHKQSKRILELADLSNMRKIYVKDLKLTLLSLNLSCLGNKRTLYMRLLSHYKNMIYYNNNINKVILVQRVIKNRLFKLRHLYKGIGFFIREEICNNQTDFYSLTDINDIPDEYFFSYKDIDNFIYAFDIRSFKKLIENNGQNPYNRRDIPEKAIIMMEKRLEFMKRHNISIEDNDDGIELTAQQKLNMAVITVFQKIDDLNTAAGGTDMNWFLYLPITHLKIFYKELEDIWNYRAELTSAMKNRIVPNNNIFKKSVNDIYHIHDINKIRYFLLEEIDTLVSSGLTEADKNLGALWVLTALTIVSPDCASALPWLIQV